MIHHVFPYDPRHLGQDVPLWAAAQLERWPLAAIARSTLAPQSRVHVIGNGRAGAGPLQIVAHGSATSGPRFRDWGDDWSLSLGHALGRLGAEDVCVLHLNHYSAARLAHRAAARSRIVLVFHGRGVGTTLDDHLLGAARLVVLRSDAAAELAALGVPRERIDVVVPSVDRSRFMPGAPPAGTERLGFVGRLDASKGVLELPPIVRALRDAGRDVGVELLGAGDNAQMAAVRGEAERLGVGEHVNLLGELPAAEVAQRMRGWHALVVPSYSEGFPIVAVEAAAAGLPVIAVAGVLPPELERRSGVTTCERERLSEVVAQVLAGNHALAAPDWVADHADGGAWWDALLTSLHPWAARPVPSVDRLQRARRIRPVRRVGRALLR